MSIPLFRSLNNAKYLDMVEEYQIAYKSFKQRRSLTARKAEVYNIKNKFPEKVPVIVERYSKEKILPRLSKTKFLVPGELALRQFQLILRARMSLDKSSTMYLLVDGKSILAHSMIMNEVYVDYHDEDGFLYLTYASQEVFG